VLSVPGRQCFPFPSAAGNVENSCLGALPIGDQRNVIEDPHGLHGCMTAAFVAIGAGMVLDQGETQTGSFIAQVGIKVDTSKGLPRLGEGGFQQTGISQACRPAGLLDQAMRKVQLFRAPLPTHQARRR